ncbi:M23 family metallopeptidase [Nocardia sp. NPDC059239]|uniref:M23 family metallopeptidase n=1 Tax=unclassified Nocardia TaxID=2637762 RepID=UPI0036AE7F55
MPETPPPTQHADVSAVPSMTASNATGAGVSPGLHTRFRLASRGHGPYGTVVRVVAGACATSLIGLCAAMPAAGGSPAPVGDFDWPLRPRPGVVRAFDKPEHDWLPGHRGVDLAGDRGQVVLAAGDGIVVFAGIVADKPVVSIDHPGGLRTTYEPVSAAIPVGRRLTRGTPIGMLEAGHPPCSPCLHWGARRDGEYLDPLGLLHRTPIRLKPLTGDIPGRPGRMDVNFETERGW